MEAAAFVLLGYFIGAIPLPQIVVHFRGVDLRKTGTGTVGASNLAQAGLVWAVAPVGVAQIGQGALPPLLARFADQSLATQVAAGLAAVGGQDWNVYLRFSGGRGLTHSLGVLLALSPLSLAALALAGIAGVLLRQIPLAMICGLALAVPVAILAGRSIEVIAGCLVLLALALIKRGLANGQSPPAGQSLPRTLLYRLLFDRDVRERAAWLSRTQSSFDLP